MYIHFWCIYTCIPVKKKCISQACPPYSIEKSLKHWTPYGHTRVSSELERNVSCVFSRDLSFCSGQRDPLRAPLTSTLVAGCDVHTSGGKDMPRWGGIAKR